MIFKLGETIVFVEVKARTKIEQGLPEEAVNPRKLWTIEKVGQQFLLEQNLWESPCRIDVVAVEFLTDPPLLRHLENVTG